MKIGKQDEGNGNMDVQFRLGADHAQLLLSFSELQNAVEGADDPTIQNVWTEFERRLLVHLDAEERHLFPYLESEHPEVVVRARTEHTRIRALLGDLGIRADLHILRKTAADALVDLLKSHAAWEDETLYAFADRELSPGERNALIKAMEMG